MAANPAFAATPLRGAVLTPATLDTSLTAPTHVATIIPAQTNGARIEQIRAIQVASLASAAIVNIFVYDGSSYWFTDFFNFTNTVAISATSEFAPFDNYYTNLLLRSTDSLVCTTTTTAGQSAIAVQAFGEAI